MQYHQSVNKRTLNSFYRQRVSRNSDADVSGSTCVMTKYPKEEGMKLVSLLNNIHR